jgi:tRNA synthetases class I (M)
MQLIILGEHDNTMQLICTAQRLMTLRICVYITTIMHEQPEDKRAFILARLAEPLNDLSISRTTFKWGIPVPEGFEKDHVMYVWFDALSNYISSIHALDPRYAMPHDHYCLHCATSVLATVHDDDKTVGQCSQHSHFLMYCHRVLLIHTQMWHHQLHCW